MFNLNGKTHNYYGVGFRYRDHEGSGLTCEQRKEWTLARRAAQKELKAMGFKLTLDSKTKAKAEKYCKEWNEKYKSAEILGPLEVHEYSYL